MRKIHQRKWYLRLTILLVLIMPLYVSAAQEKVTVRGNSITQKQAIQMIEKSSGYTFFFKSSDLDNNTKKDLNCEGSLNEVLTEIFKGSNISFVVKGKDVILKANQIEKIVPQQQKKSEIIGVIIDEKTGEPVIGATIQVKGSKTGVISDVDGKFGFQASQGDILIISYIGYQTQEKKLDKQKVISIELREDSKTLEEVVITAYGTGQKKASMVGSVEAIRPSDLKVPATNLSNAFAGRLSGVIAVQRSGQPGADGASFWIRGISTLSDATDPLIILDGIQVSASDLNNLDPEIIDNFSILKDATATAMYGTRGANGVMIVTTKSGGNMDKPIINFRFEGQFSQPTSTPKFVEGANYMELFNEAVTNDGSGEILYSSDKIAGTREKRNPYIYPNVNWYNELFKNSTFNEKFNFNIRGGGKRVDYFSSISVIHEEGMLKNRSEDFFSYNNNINNMRYTFQNNINAHLGQTSKLSLRLNVQLRDWKQPNQDVNAIFANTMNTSPVEFPVMFEPDGVTPYVKWGSTQRLVGDLPNPVAQMTTGYSDSFASTVIAALEFEQKLDFLTKGLRFKALVSFKNWSSTTNARSANWNKFTLTDYSHNEDGNYTYNASRIGEELNTTLGITNSTAGNRRIYAEAMFDYSRTFGKHDVNAMFIYNQDESVNNVPGNNVINSLPRRKQGLAARASYAYDGKYMAEINLGYNGSENFAKGHRFGLFPSVAVGYNLSEEEFFKPLTTVFSRLKVRASYGLVGNDQIGGDRFIYMSQINLSGIGFTTGLNQNYGLNGPTYTRYANEGITWEVGEKLNIGLDLQLFKSLDMTLDFFRENRHDIFQQRSTIPNYLGTATTKVYGNLAKMKNQGFDLSISYNKQINKNFFASFKSTFTYAHNEIVAYDESPAFPFQSKVGVSANVNGGYISDGLFVDQADINNYKQQLGSVLKPGDIKYQNISNQRYGYGDEMVDSNDWMWLGNPTVPEIVYGFGPSFKWKQLDFSFFFQGVAKTSLFVDGFHPFGDNSLRNVLEWVAEERWSPDNQNSNATYPRLSRNTNENNTQTSDYWMRNGAFLKLKNAEVGYTYKNMRLYVSGSNLLTFSPFKLWDPEQGGGSGLKYPTQRVFNIGFQMTLNNK